MTPEERAAFLALLRKLEWSDGRDVSGDYCPVCESPRYRPGRPGVRSHADWCELAACVRVLEGESPPPPV